MLWITLYWLVSSVIGFVLTGYHLVIATHRYRHHLGAPRDEGMQIISFGRIRQDCFFIAFHTAFSVAGMIGLIRIAQLDLAQAIAFPSYTWDQWIILLAFASIPLGLIILTLCAADDEYRVVRTRPPSPR